MASLDLFNRNVSLVPAMINRHFKIHSNIEEDAIQHGLIALYKASLTFDETKAKFSTYACTCIRRAIMTFLTKEYSRRPMTIESLEGIIDNKIVHVELNINEKLPHLSEKEKDIVTMRYEGSTYKEIAKKYNTSKQNIESNLRRIRKQCKHLQES